MPRVLFRILKMILTKQDYSKVRECYNKSLTTPYEIVSLGASCYPKTILTRHKLKKLRAEGEITLPFDLAWFHESVFITDFIKDDFDGFFSDMRYIEDIKCWDNFRKINFSHEKDFGPADKDLLIDKYFKRIQNFRNILNSDKPILFFQFLKTNSVGEDVNNLYRTLKEKRQGKPFELLVVDCIDIVKDAEPEINLLRLNLLVANPNLYEVSFYKSKEGKLFEKKIIQKCKSILEDKLNVNPRLYL